MPVTRQLRLTASDAIRRHLPGFVGKPINVVLNDRRVLVGELLTIAEKGITIRNMRLRKVKIPFSALNEVYFDTIAAC